MFFKSTKREWGIKFIDGAETDYYWFRRTEQKMDLVLL